MKAFSTTLVLAASLVSLASLVSPVSGQCDGMKMDDSVTKMDFHSSTLTENTLHLPGGKLRYSRKYM